MCGMTCFVGMLEIIDICNQWKPLQLTQAYSYTWIAKILHVATFSVTRHFHRFIQNQQIDFQFIIFAFVLGLFVALSPLLCKIAIIVLRFTKSE